MEGGCLQGKLSSPGFIPTRGQSKLGEKLLRCLLWDQRTPPSQLDPAEKHTGMGLSSSLPPQHARAGSCPSERQS